MSKPDMKPREVNYGSSPFGKASPYISAAAFALVLLFVSFVESLASALNLNYGDIQAITLCTAFAGAFVGFTATWDTEPKGKSLGRTFCILNLIVFFAYGVLFLAFEYGRK
jgi:uncharacterized membrane-anchored protein YitT (DUF2179 family)